MILKSGCEASFTKRKFIESSQPAKVISAFVIYKDQIPLNGGGCII